MLTGAGMGFLFSTAMNTGTFGVSPSDAGVASATVNTGQQLGGSIGTSLFNTIATSAAASYVAAQVAAAHGRPSSAALQQIQASAMVHGYVTVFWVCFWIFLGGAAITGALMRRGPLHAPAQSARPAVAEPAKPAAATVQE
jgi:hypothetical protein